MATRDVIVAGGGPAGLAFAAAAARRGLDVVVVEKRAGPVDKACGEGILPAGLRALEELGALEHVDRAEASAIPEIRWIEPDGASVTLRLPPPGGLTVRRTALSAALAATARAAGAEIRVAEVVDHRREADGVTVELRPGRELLRARALVAADGLASPIRRREGLDRLQRSARRYGLRRHFALSPWCDAVEVHFGRGAEAYVTPVGPRQVGVAFLFERGEGGAHGSLLARFPLLAARLGDAAPSSAPRAAGPLARRSAVRVKDRLVLLGDAAGYEDALTGDGLSIAFGCALDLARILPGALARGATAESLWEYERAWAARFRPYLAWTRTMLWLTRHPRVRRRVLLFAAALPAGFERLLKAVEG